MSPDAAGVLSSDEVRALLSSDFWVRIEGGGATGSTNDDARALALEGAPEGTVVLASAQTSGRGRMGRAWESPEGGVYLSALLRPPAGPPALAPLPLVVGLGVAYGLERLGVVPRLKWPNDVLVDGGKVAGVLVESGADSRGTRWAVAGIGLNVARPSAAGDDGDGVEVPPGAAFLGDRLAVVTFSQVAAAVLDGVAGSYAAFLADGFAGVRVAYLERSATVGTDVQISDPSGGLVADGAAVDIDEAGLLVVDSVVGRVAVASGELTLRPRA